MDSVATAGAFLAIIALSDGLRMLPAGTVVIRRTPFGGWTLPPSWADPRRLALVSWCIPLALPLIVALGCDGSATEPLRRRVTRFRARHRRVRSYVAALRIIGLATLVGLIVGLPLLIARSGVWGLAAGVALVFSLAVVQSTISALAFMRTGLSVRAALRAAARFCWPFASPRAAEEVQRRVVGHVPGLVLLEELLPREEFERIGRPIMYDALVRGAASPDAAALLQHHGTEAARALIERTPADSAVEAYCPRCGSGFYRGPRVCSDCGDVELISAIAT